MVLGVVRFDGADNGSNGKKTCELSSTHRNEVDKWEWKSNSLK